MENSTTCWRMLSDIWSLLPVFGSSRRKSRKRSVDKNIPWNCCSNATMLCCWRESMISAKISRIIFCSKISAWLCSWIVRTSIGRSESSAIFLQPEQPASPSVSIKSQMIQMLMWDKCSIARFSLSETRSDRQQTTNRGMPNEDMKNWDGANKLNSIPTLYLEFSIFMPPT